LADICFAAEMALFDKERPRQALLHAKGLPPILAPTLTQDYPLATAHFERLARHPAFAPDLGPYLAKHA
jgi:elongation factor 1-gamma